MPTPSELSFISFQVTKTILERSADHIEGKFAVQVGRSVDKNKKNKKEFDLTFIVSVHSEEKQAFGLTIEALGKFCIKGNVTEEIENNFINISAPIIVYPYIRALISNLTVQVGMKPIILPPLNFTVEYS